MVVPFVHEHIAKLPLLYLFGAFVSKSERDVYHVSKSFGQANCILLSRGTKNLIGMEYGIHMDDDKK